MADTPAEMPTMTKNSPQCTKNLLRSLEELSKTFEDNPTICIRQPYVEYFATSNILSVHRWLTGKSLFYRKGRENRKGFLVYFLRALCVLGG